MIWTKLRASQLGYPFLRQKPIGNYIVDFVCRKKKLIIEIDGDTHDSKKDYDKRRDIFLNKMGFHVFHVTDQEVLVDLDGVTERIYYLLHEHL